MMLKSRIAVLDGFRGVAIIAVMFFHFFSRWIPPRNDVSLYPYGNAYDFFGYGFLGVHFFFMISGFVIHFTLAQTRQFGTFWKKRMIRLLPSMIIASLITLFIFRFFDKDLIFPASHEYVNLVPGISFISPLLLNKIFNGTGFHFAYLSRSYWSLWPEIQFYVFISLIYFLDKKHFIRNFLILSFLMILFTACMNDILTKNSLGIHFPVRLINFYKVWLWGIFGLAAYLPFFCCGVLLCHIYQQRDKGEKVPIWVFLILFVTIFYIMIMEKSAAIQAIYLAMIILFLLFIYFPAKLSFMGNKYLLIIGFSSYFLYLIHEQIGVLIIYSFGKYFNAVSFLLPILIMFLLIIISWLFTEKLDRRIILFLKGKWIKDA